MNRVRVKKALTVRLSRLAASAVAVAAVAGAAGVGADQGQATIRLKADNASQMDKAARFKDPNLKNGLLTIEGTNASEAIALRLQAGEPGILQVDIGDDGLAEFNFERADIARIEVDARAGADTVRIDEGNGLFTDGIPTTIDGGSGNDRLAGGTGTETLLGGSGRDSIDGNRGDDVAFMGAGGDTFVWDPGDGSDVVEGQGGADAMLFNGANVAEQVELSANGNRLRFFRDVAGITMDTDGVERVDFNALGGADLVTVNDLARTDVNEVNVDLAAVGGIGDGQPDRVVVNGTGRNDRITVDGDAERVEVSGLAATIAVLHPEAANDRLEINTLAGRDTVDSGGLAAGVIQLFVDGVLVP